MSGRSISGSLRRRKIIHKSVLPENTLLMRRMVKVDLEAVMRIERLSFANPWHRSTFEGEIDNESISEPLVIIYVPEDRIIGYVITWMDKKEAQISNIAVDPRYRRMGVGECVLRRILRHRKRMGFRRIILEVRPSNSGAIKLYEKLGFRIVGKRLQYYQRPVEDALLMLKMMPVEKKHDE